MDYITICLFAFRSLVDSYELSVRSFDCILVFAIKGLFLSGEILFLLAAKWLLYQWQHNCNLSDTYLRNISMEKRPSVHSNFI